MLNSNIDKNSILMVMGLFNVKCVSEVFIFVIFERCGCGVMFVLC